MKTVTLSDFVIRFGGDQAVLSFAKHFKNSKCNLNEKDLGTIFDAPMTRVVFVLRNIENCSHEVRNKLFDSCRIHRQQKDYYYPMQEALYKMKKNSHIKLIDMIIKDVLCQPIEKFYTE